MIGLANSFYAYVLMKFDGVETLKLMLTYFLFSTLFRMMVPVGYNFSAGLNPISSDCVMIFAERRHVKTPVTPF
jgi:hypothetical protein